MGLLDEIQASVRAPGTTCRVREVLAVLGKEAGDLTSALGDGSIPASAIVRALHARDVKLSDSSIGRHRRGECTCP